MPNGQRFFVTHCKVEPVTYFARLVITIVIRAEVDRQNLFKGPQIANPQILGLIPQLQINKFLRCASPQIANPQIFMIYLQIENPQMSTK